MVRVVRAGGFRAFEPDAFGVRDVAGPDFLRPSPPDQGPKAAGRLKPAELVTATVPLEETWPVLQSMERFATAGFVVIDRY